MVKTSTEDLLVAVLARVTMLESILHAFVAAWILTGIPEVDQSNFRESRGFKVFDRLCREGFGVLVENLAEQFPDLEKMIREHLELSMVALITKAGEDKT